jgi:hypothetical protein
LRTYLCVEFDTLRNTIIVAIVVRIAVIDHHHLICTSHWLGTNARKLNDDARIKDMKAKAKAALM